MKRVVKILSIIIKQLKIQYHQIKFVPLIEKIKQVVILYLIQIIIILKIIIITVQIEVLV